MSHHRLEPMVRLWAEEIAAWRYPGEYALYSFDGSEECIDELLAGGYFAWLNEAGRPEGYFCFGAPAQIPTQEADVYPDGPLDVGLGLAPDLCGRGQGAAFLADGLAFAGEQLGAASLRLTVAGFNARAKAVYTRAGFVPRREVRHRLTGMAFTVMVREDA